MPAISADTVTLEKLSPVATSRRDPSVAPVRPVVS